MSRRLGLEIAHACHTKLLIKRHYGVDESRYVEHLKWMCEEIENNSHEWPTTKLHRWVGYIQGQMVAFGISSLEDEKNLVRELKNQFGGETVDTDLIDHNNPKHPFELDIGEQD